ncbi:MAG: MoxR-like ATPases, partial [uncultured Frankineae bacterium]
GRAAPRGRAGAGRSAGRAAHAPRGAARHRQVDPAAGSRAGRGPGVRVRRGQRRAHAGPPGGPPRPLPGDERGLHRRRLRRRPARGGHACGRAAVRRGDQPRPRGDAQRPHHRDERGRAARPAARPAGRGRGLPPRRRDEPLRRGRHGPHRLGHLRPHLPGPHGLPGRRRRGGDRAAQRRGPGRRRAGRRAGAAHPRPPGGAGRLVRARRDRPGPRRDVPGGAAGRPARRPRRQPRRRPDRAVRSDAAARGELSHLGGRGARAVGGRLPRRRGRRGGRRGGRRAGGSPPAGRDPRPGPAGQL